MSEILCSMLLHSVSIKTFFFVQMVEILYEFCCWILQYYQTRIDLNLLCLSGIWTNLMIQGSDIVVCGTLMWIHVCCRQAETWVMTRVVSCGWHMITTLSLVCRVCLYEVSELTIAVATCPDHTCLICQLHLGHVLRHLEIFKYFLLYLLYVDNYFHRIKIYLQRKQCVLFYTVYDQQASQSKPVCIVQSF